MTHRFQIWLIASIVATGSVAAQMQPEVKWVFEAKSNLYAPPLVADMHPSPGLETVISDAEARCVRCLDAHGKQLWEYAGGWKKRLTSSCALIENYFEDTGTLAVLGSDGLLCVFDSKTAMTLWKKQLPSGTTWGGVLWADVGAENGQDLVVGTERDGVYAFDTDGKELWHYMAQQEGAPLEIMGCLAAGDIDYDASKSVLEGEFREDNRDEIFVCGKRGVFCLNSDGALLWETITGDEFSGAPTLDERYFPQPGGIIYSDAAETPSDSNDRKDEHKWYVTATSHNADAVLCFSADDGKVIWRTPLPGDPGVYASSVVAVGNIDQCIWDDQCSDLNDAKEIVAGTDTGVLSVLHPPKRSFEILKNSREKADPTHENKPDKESSAEPAPVSSTVSPLSWAFSTDTPASIVATLGDVDGDGFIEVLAASGDHNLYCLSRDGRLKWKYETGMRLTSPPTLIDLDGDFIIEIVLCGADKKVYCLSVSGASRSGLLSWPSRRKTPKQCGDAIDTFYGEIMWTSGSTRFWDSGDYEFSDIPYRPHFNGGFELDRTCSGMSQPPDTIGTRLKTLPLGWQTEAADALPGTPEYALSDASIFLDSVSPYEGKTSLLVTGPARIASQRISFDRPVRLIRAAIHARGNGVGGIMLRFFSSNGKFVEKAFNKGKIKNRWNPILEEQSPKNDTADDENTWSLYSFEEFVPKGIDSATISGVQFVLDCGPGQSFWDAASLETILLEVQSSQVFVNQVGYDVGALKPFLVKSNTDFQELLSNKVEFPDHRRSYTTDPHIWHYVLLNENDETVKEGKLEAAGRTVGAYGNDWECEYWRANLDDINTPGMYRIKVWMEACCSVRGAMPATSVPFMIGPDLLFEQTAEPAYRYFYYQRCGMAIPGFHGACHLDDAVAPDGTQYECWGGWHDAGDYNTYVNAPYVLGLERAYGMRRADFDAWDRDGNGRADLFDEILWGGDHTRRMLAEDGSARGSITSGYGFWSAPELETDNLPGTGDERPISAASGGDPGFHQAALARIGLMLAGGESRVGTKDVDDADAPPVTAQAWLDAAARSLAWSIARGQRGPLQFSTAVDLFAATQKQEYRELAGTLLNELGLADLHADGWFAASISYTLVDAVERWDALSGEDHRVALGAALTAKAEAMLPLADNVFGVYTFGPAEKPNFFGTPAAGSNEGWHVGTSSYLLDAATVAALAYKYNPDPRFLKFAYDQLNWTLGLNPYGVSLMEGCGSAFVPTYHHRYAFSGVPRGAVPGSVINGITWRGVGDDRPFLDRSGVDIPHFQSNESWLPHNVHYLNAIAALRGAR